MITREELKNVIEILTRRCNLRCTEDHATNIMTYDEWVDNILCEYGTRYISDNVPKTGEPVPEYFYGLIRVNCGKTHALYRCGYCEADRLRKELEETKTKLNTIINAMIKYLQGC
jgi:hypothetical protein